MENEITLQSLPMAVQRALRLLRKNAQKAPQGIGNPDGRSCPIAQAYDIGASAYWDDLNGEDRKLLARNGWTACVYEEFIRWHDNEVARPDSAERAFLTNFLAVV